MPKSYSTPLLEKNIVERPMNQDGKPRRMGVEIELAGLTPEVIVEVISQEFGGNVIWQSPFEINVEDSELGTFKIELDSEGVKKIGKDSAVEGNPVNAKNSLDKTYIDTIGELASHLVPWEIVTAPIEFSKIPRLFPMVERLRDRGAKGTKAALHYAFGVHLNPELSDLGSTAIVKHLKSFFCLYEWIRLVEKPDLARRLTPYINHFQNDYITKVLQQDYNPDIKGLIRDYLEHNPTRNRSLDMLPLFLHLQADLVKQSIEDERVNPRPTFHYRLPNCEIAEENWNLDRSIETWMAVEILANDPRLQTFCDEYLVLLQRPLPIIGSNWGKEIASKLSLPIDQPAS